MRKTPGKIPADTRKVLDKDHRGGSALSESCDGILPSHERSKEQFCFWFKRLRVQHPEWHDLTNHPEVIVPQRQSAKQANKSNGNGNGNGDGSLPSTEVTVKARRRKWSGVERERILKEAGGLSGVDLSAFLRRERLYVHTLNKWRTQEIFRISRLIEQVVLQIR